MTLSFSRNKVAGVEVLGDGSLAVSWRLVDTLTEAEIRLKVRVPDLEIAEAEARLERSPHPECRGGLDLIPNLVGVRIGSGLRKIVQGLMGGAAGCAELTEGILECGNAVILHFTLPQLQATATGDEEETRRKFQEMLRCNPRLVRSCIAFADDSPLLNS